MCLSRHNLIELCRRKKYGVTQITTPFRLDTPLDLSAAELILVSGRTPLESEMQIRKKGQKWYFLRSKYFTEGVGADHTKRSMAVVIGSADYLSESCVKFHPDPSATFTDAEAQQWRTFIAAEMDKSKVALTRSAVSLFPGEITRFQDAVNRQPELLTLDALEKIQENLRSLAGGPAGPEEAEEAEGGAWGSGTASAGACAADGVASWVLTDLGRAGGSSPQSGPV